MSDTIGEIRNYDLSKAIRPEDYVSESSKKTMKDFLELYNRQFKLGDHKTFPIYQGDSYVDSHKLFEVINRAKIDRTYVQLGNILVTVEDVSLSTTRDFSICEIYCVIYAETTIVCTDVSKIVYQPILTIKDGEERNRRVDEMGKLQGCDDQVRSDVKNFYSAVQKKLKEDPEFLARAMQASSFNAYQKAALRTRGPKSDTIDLCFGLMGETGEVIDQVKKHLYQGHPKEQVRGKIKEELGDVMWYAALMAFDFDIDLAEVFEGNVEKLKKRFPDGFDEKRSLDRRDII